MSLVEPPDFSFNIQLQGGDITFLPGLEIWITDFIKSAVLEPYVLPEGMTIPLDPSANKAEAPPPPPHTHTCTTFSLPKLTNNERLRIGNSL